MAVKVKFNPLPAQKEVFEDDITKTMLFSGGLGSGKTYVAVMKAIRLSNINKNVAGGFLCPDMKMFEKDVLPTFRDILDRHKVKYRYHQTKHYFLFPWNKKPLYIFTGEKEIAGPNLGYCLINEYSLIRYERIKEMLRRVRVKHAKCPQKLLVGTPEDKFGWLEEFVESMESKGNFRITYADTRENVHIADDYREDLESMLDEQALKVFAGGQMVRMGSDYFYYAYDKTKNTDKTIKRDMALPLHVALDFNVGKMCASFANKIEQGLSGKSELHFFEEVELTGNSDTFSMGTYIVNHYIDGYDGITYDNWMLKSFDDREAILDHITITCDAAGKNRSVNGKPSVKILREMGFKVRHKSSNPRMRKRQLAICGLFSHSRIMLHPRCKKLSRDFEKVQQNKQDFTKVKDKDDRLTHFSDGADYLIMYELADEVKSYTFYTGTR